MQIWLLGWKRKHTIFIRIKLFHSKKTITTKPTARYRWTASELVSGDKLGVLTTYR